MSGSGFSAKRLRIGITDHARSRMEQRLSGMVGADPAKWAIDYVREAIENGRYTRKAPSWLRGRDQRSGSGVRYVRSVDPKCVLIVRTDEKKRGYVIVTVVAPSRIRKPVAAL